MKQWLAGLGLLCAGGALFWYLLHAARSTQHVSGVAPPVDSANARPGRPPASAPQAPGPQAPAEPAAAGAQVPSPTPVPNPPAAIADANLPPCTLPPATVLDNMRTVFRSYTSMFGGNPVGTNPEITRALTGNNAKHAQFINPDSGLRINGNGELVDAWGTPFFFHQLSGTVMEIHSAGPDRKMWTADDLVTK